MSNALQIIINAVDNASSVINGVKNSVAGLSAIGDAGGSMVGLGTAIAAPIAGIGIAATKAAVDFESAMADVAKASNIPVGSAQYRELSNEIMQMSRTIPRAATELAAISAEGARLGVDTKNLGNFTNLMSRMAVAFDMTAEEAASGGAKIANSFKMVDASGQMDFQRLERFGDVVNTLGDSMATTERQIMSFSREAAGVASVYRMSETDVAALGAAFTSLGIAPERAARAFNATAVKLATATDMTPDAQAGLKALGIDAKEMQQAFESGKGTDAYMNFLKQVQKAGPAAGSALNKIFGAGWSDEIMRAAAGIDQFDKALEASKKKAGDDGFSTMQSSFDIFASTTASQAKLFQNAMNEIGVAIGSAILPALNQIMAAIRPVMMAFADFARANPGIMAVAVAIAGVVAALAAGAAAVGGFLMAIASVGTAIATISGGIKAAAPMLKSFGAAAGAAASGGLAMLKSALLAIAPLALLAGAMVAVAAGVIAAGAYLATGSWEGVGEVFAAIPAVLAELPQNLAQIPAAIGAMISAAQAMIGNFAAGVKLAFATVKHAMTQAFAGNFAPAIAMFSAIASAIGSTFASIGGMIGAVIMGIVNTVISIATMIPTIIMGIINGIVSGIAMISVMISTVIMGIVNTIMTIGTMITTVVMAIINSIMATLSMIGMMIATVIMGIITAIMTAGMMIMTTVTTIITSIMATLSSIGAAISAIVASISAGISGAVSAISAGISGAVSAIMAGVAQISSAISSGIQGAIGVIQGMAGAFAAAGQALMQSLAQGIMAGAQAAISAVGNVASQLRAMLPFSPAKEGPLSDLDKTGPALVSTMAAGITATPLLGALGSALAPIPSMVAGAGQNDGMNMPMPSVGSGAAGGSVINLNYAPVINGDGSPDLINILREHSKELMALLEELQRKSDRTSYA